MAAPIYLLADSQPLFWRSGGVPFFTKVLTGQKRSQKLALYIGASNGDLPEYYSLFSEAMSEFTETDWLKADSQVGLERLLEADLILLAGGDVQLGWEFIETLKSTLHEAHQSGTILVGVSAGAIHLGAQWWQAKGSNLKSLDTLGLVPAVLAAHEEALDWQPIRSAILAAANQATAPSKWPALGLPFGSAVRYELGMFESCLADSAGKQAVKFEWAGGELIKTQF